MDVIEYRRNFAIDNDVYNRLRLQAWGREDSFDWSPVLARSLVWITAYVEDRLIGFVNVASDGCGHMLLLDTTVDPDHQLRGVGSELVKRAIEMGVEAGGDWMHVDSDEVLMRDLYGPFGFCPTAAGLVNLRAVHPESARSAILSRCSNSSDSSWPPSSPASAACSFQRDCPPGRRLGLAPDDRRHAWGHQPVTDPYRDRAYGADFATRLTGARICSRCSLSRTRPSASRRRS